MSASRRASAFSTLYFWALCLALAAGCDDGGGGNLPDGGLAPDQGIPDAGVDAAGADAGGDASPGADGAPAGEAGVCDPDPFAPARPRWSEVLPAPDNGSGYPDYETISNNFNVLKSMKLLISIVTKATEKLEAVRSADLAAEAENLLDPAQVFGHCICNDCGNLQPEDIWENAKTAVAELAGNVSGNLPGTFAEILEEIITTRVNLLIARFEQAVAAVDGGPDAVVGDIESVVEMHVQQVISSAAATAQSVDAAATGISTDVNDYVTEMQAAYQELRDQIQMDFATVKQSIETLLDPNTTPSIRRIWQDLTRLWEIFRSIDGIDDLTCPDTQAEDDCVDFAEVDAIIGDLTTEIEAVIQTAQTAIDAVTNSYDAAVRALQIAQSLTQQLRDDLEQRFQQAIAGTGVTLQDLQADLDQLDNLPAAIQLTVQGGLDDILAGLQSAWDGGQLVADGTGLGDQFGDFALNALDAQLLQPVRQIVADSLDGCYARVRRNACYDYCDPNGGVFLWFPVDFLKDPKAAGAAALFVLKQIGFLDEIAQLDMGDSPFLDAVDAALGALGDAATALANLQELLQKLFDYVDLFTEGYHLGGYDTLRPDLHMCVGYAGHGAYAQMGNLGNGKVSIGARYTSHNVSRKHRAQFRSGGFAVSAFGRALSLAPTIEINKQIDGWRFWNAQKPFGIDAASIPVADIEKYDVFHLVDQGELASLASGGQISWGNFIVRDLFPASYGDPGSPSTWPRPDAAGAPWEGRATAVLSAGLNLEFEMEPRRWDLPTIPIIPGVLTATPYFALSAGVAWLHDANKFRQEIQDKINANLDPADRLGPEDFRRDMHDFQADDLSADDGTTAYVEPEVGVSAFLGFKIWKLRIGAGADLGLSVKIEPGGFGGIVDLNAALSDLLNQSNPPADAPCEPVFSETRRKVCSNTTFVDAEGQPASEADYACEPAETQSSCCIRINGTGFCIDDWTGITEEHCGYFDLPHATREDALEALDQIPSGIAPGLVGRIRDLLTDPEVAEFELDARWNAGQSCAESECEARFTTAVVNVTGLSECERHGYCVYPDGSVAHDVTEGECERPAGATGCYAVLPEDGPRGLLRIGDATETVPALVVDAQGPHDPAWIAWALDQAQSLAGQHAHPVKCETSGWCLNFSHLPAADAQGLGFAGQGAWAQAPWADYPLTVVGAGSPQTCPRGLDAQGQPIGPAQGGGEVGSTPSAHVPFVWREGAPVGRFTPYGCLTKIDEELTGWAGDGCSPLDHGFPSACGCETDDHCAAGETCADGRCVGAGGAAFSCVCGANGACPNGRVCHQGACVTTCQSDADCAGARVCDAGRCAPPHGIPTAETIVWGMHNVTAPMHAIASYALSNILFLARFKAAVYVEASFKLFGKERKWRLLDFADVWDLGSTYKSWYQPGLEARYHHQCSPDDPSAGVTNRFPVAPTQPPAALEAAGVDLRPSCQVLSGGVCRYPENPSAAWDALPPAVRDPDDWTAPNAGDLATFLAWCKQDMPAHAQDPEANTQDDLIDGVTGTVQWGHEVGLEIWAQQQLCIDGRLWNEWLGSLEGSFAQYDCRYTDPGTGQTYTFPCAEMSDEILAIWGCLDAGANVYATALAQAFPYLVHNHPTHGPIFDLDQMFDPVMVPVQHPDGTVTIEPEMQYTLAALEPYIRHFHSPLPFFVPNVGQRWLQQVDACFEARYEDPAETRCECASDADCDADAGDRCVNGACEERRVVDEDCAGGECTPVYAYFRKECPPVRMVVEAGPCCGDGVVQRSESPPYVEACDDGNTVDGDGCSSTCEVEEGGEPGGCHAVGDRCVERCPDGQRCDESCTVCLEEVEPAPRCRRDQDTGVCVNECPPGLACDYDCLRCVDDGPTLPCQMAGDQCLDTCPDGRRCDEQCRACVPVDPPSPCRLDDAGVCVDACPGDLVCDEACARCVEPPAACRRDADGQCLDRCPDGQQCDPDCARCIDAPPPACSRDADGQCLDRCPDGQRCDDNCTGCVAVDPGRCVARQAPRACRIRCDEPRPGEDENCCTLPYVICTNDCARGFVCDDACGACVPDDGGGFPCQRSGDRCLDRCPDGQTCDDQCGRCVEAAPAACRRDAESGLCLDECPAGRVCDGECGACVENADCADDCHRRALRALRECVAAGGDRRACADRAFEQLVACADACGAGDCDRACHRAGQATWGRCVDGGRDPLVCEAVALDAIRACRAGCP